MVNDEIYYDGEYSAEIFEPNYEHDSVICIIGYTSLELLINNDDELLKRLLAKRRYQTTPQPDCLTAFRRRHRILKNRFTVPRYS